MRTWALGALILLAVLASSCGSNSTPIGVVVTGPSISPMTILLGNSVQFGATVSGGSTTTVYFQICLPATSGTTNPPTKPTNCTQGQGTGAPTVTNPLTGYGTITATGLYTAPSTLPATNTLDIVATSSVSATSFGIFVVNLDSGIRVQVLPLNPTIGLTDTLQFTADVTGNPTNPAVSWTLSGPPSTNLGTISASGLYQAPGAAVTVTVTATSSEDPTQKGSTTLTVSAGGQPEFSTDLNVPPLDPSVAAEGSAQLDVYLNGKNFLSTEAVTVNDVVVPSTFISPTLMRATIPATFFAQAGKVHIDVRMNDGVTTSSNGPEDLLVFSVRPALIASSPDSVTQGSPSAAINLTGGYFSPDVSATFGGQAVAAAFNGSRLMSLSVPGADIAAPGLYPIVVQNNLLAPGAGSMSGLNLAVTPSSFPGAPSGSIGVGSSPQAIAIDEADGFALVTGNGDHTLSCIALGSLACPGGFPLTLPGNHPTGIAVDDVLTDPVALVVNNTDQTVTAIDLVSLNTTTLNVSISAAMNPPLPYSIGVNPLTHRAIVAYQSTNEATVLNVSVAGGIPSISVVQQVGGSLTNFSTGAHPAVAIDPHLNWGVITPGGGGIVNIVDLGLPAGADAAQGRAPQVIGALSLTTTVQGVGINTETHTALLTDPQSNTLTTFSLLDSTVNAISLSGAAPSGFVASAATPLENLGVAVSTNGTAEIVDLQNDIILQTVTGLGTTPQAVAVDPVSNQAVVVNQVGNSVSLVSLNASGTPLKTPQIVEASPAVTFVGTGPDPLPLTINGGAFAAGSKVFLDGVPLSTAISVSASRRQIMTTVPQALLGAAQNHLVQVVSSGEVSNIAELTAIQPIQVGATPIGVSVDTDRDMAVVTNMGEGTLSMVSLAANAPGFPQSRGGVGVVLPKISVGTNPQGVGVIPRLGLALVANNGSNNISLVDIQKGELQLTSLSGTGCTAIGSTCGQVGVAFNQDTSVPIIANSTSNTVSTATLAAPPAPTAGNPDPKWGISVGSGLPVDQNPIAVAVDPMLDSAAVATASTASSVEFLNMQTSSTVGRASGLQNPSGVVFDPLNQVFLAANSLVNNVDIIDPSTFIQTPVRTGIAPMSLDYNFQTSTLVTANSATHTLSILDYVCPPSTGIPACVGPKVRAVLGLGGTLTSNPILGPNAVAIDPKLNLVVLVDPDNNRVLLVPLPH